MTVGKAYLLRGILEKAAQSLPDKEASQAATFFPRLMQDGSLIKAGTMINWGGVVKRAASDLWDTEENTPDAAPALWEDISYREGYRIITDTLTSGLAFDEGECGWWDGVLYRSKIASNVWTPAAYPDGWELAEGGGNE